MLFKIYTKERQLNSKGKCLMWTFLQKTVQDLTRKNAAKKPRELNSWLWVLKSTLPQRQLHIFSFFHRKLFQPFWQWIRNKNHLLKKKKNMIKRRYPIPHPPKSQNTPLVKSQYVFVLVILPEICVFIFRKWNANCLNAFGLSGSCQTHVWQYCQFFLYFSISTVQCIPYRSHATYIHFC